MQQNMKLSWLNINFKKIALFNSLTKSFEHARKKGVGKLKCPNFIANKGPKSPRHEIDCSLSNNGFTVEAAEEEDTSKFDVKSNMTMPSSSNAVQEKRDGGHEYKLKGINFDNGDACKNSPTENQTVRGLGDEASTSVQQDPFCCGMDDPNNVEIRKRRNVEIDSNVLPFTSAYSDSVENETGDQEDEEPDFMELDTMLSALRGIRISNGGVEVDFRIV